MDSSVIHALLCVCCAIWLVRWRTDPLKHIPAIGPSLPILSFLGTYAFLSGAQDKLQEGYEKYTVFRVALINRWLVIVSGAKMNDELCKYPDDQLSFMEAVADMVYPDWTIQPDVHHIPIHVDMIKERLTRNLDPIIPEMVDEVLRGFEEFIPASETEWLPVTAFPTARKILARANNRIFIGAPLCRNEELLDVSANLMTDVRKGSAVLTFVPPVLLPIIERLLPWSRRARQHILPLVKPILDERRKQLDLHGGEWADKLNDFLMWCMEDAMRRGLGHPEDLLVQIILAMKFAALHNSTVGFVHALYHLAADPEYIQPLREEAELVLQEEGESKRMNGVGGITILRKAMKDVTFSDGTYIPGGTIVAAVATSTHRDDQDYANADVFDPFRFWEQEGEISKQHYVSTSPTNLGFGHGKHACPGRFFAANELKIMMANLVVEYDIKFADEGCRVAGNA